MKYGSQKYADGTHWGETVSSFTEDDSTTVSFAEGGTFSEGYFGMGLFGVGEYGAVTVTYTEQNPTTVVYS